MRSLRVILSLLTLCIAMAVQSTTVHDGKIVAEQMPAYVIFGDDKISIEHLADSTFNRRAASTIFKVNRSNLNMDDSLIHQLAERIIPMAGQHDLKLVRIEMRGGASPEGPLWFNIQLGQRRVKALADFIQAALDSTSVTEIETSYIAEDYPYLQWLLEQRGDAAASTVRDIIEQYTLDDPVSIKSALQHVDGGLLWRRLLREYYPELRAARVVLFFSRRDNKSIHVADEPTASLAITDASTPVPALEPTVPVTLERMPMLSVSTNVLYDAFYMPQFGWAPMPNINLEFFPKRSNFTFRAGFMFPYYHKWNKNKFFQIRDYHLEARYYTRPGLLHTGFYVGAYANASKYGIGLSAKKGWQGEGYGGALKVGYVVPLRSGRWRIDFHIAAGGYVTRYDPYVFGNPVTGEVNGDYYYDWTGASSDFKRRNHRLTWFGPTEVGITISYDLLYWRIRRKGASAIRKEVVLP